MSESSSAAATRPGAGRRLMSSPVWRRHGLTLGLAVLAVVGNHLNLSLFFGVHVIFGSVAVLLAIVWLGARGGLVVAACSAAYTYVLWEHLLAGPIFMAEAGFVVWHRWRARRRGLVVPPLVISDSLYWLVIGIPLVLLLYHGGLAADTPQPLLIAVKQPLNGILNAAIAGVVLILVDWVRSRHAGLSMREALFNLLLIVGLLPLMVVGARESQELKHLLERDLGARLRLFGEIMVDVLERRPAHDRPLDSVTLSLILAREIGILTASLPADSALDLALLDEPIATGGLRPDKRLEATAAKGLSLVLPEPHALSNIRVWRQSRYRLSVPFAERALIISVSAAPVVDEVHRAAARFLMVLLTLAIFWILVSEQLSRQLVRPLQRLAALAAALPGRILAGEPLDLPEPGFLSETADLTRAIEDMARVLQTTYVSLVRGEARLNESQAIAHLGSWELDADTGALIWSDEMYRLLGYSPGAVTPSLDAFFARVDPDDAQWLRELLETLLRGAGEQSIREVRIQGADGVSRTLSGFARTQHDEAGHLVRIVGTSLDITRQQAESERRHQLEQMLMRHAWNLEAVLGLSNSVLPPAEEQRALLALGSAELGLEGGVLGLIAPEDSNRFQVLTSSPVEWPVSTWQTLARYLPLAAILAEPAVPVLAVGKQLSRPLRRAGVGSCAMLVQRRTVPGADSCLIVFWGRAVRTELSVADRELLCLIGQRIAARQTQADLEQALVMVKERETIGHLASGVVHDFNNLLGVVGANLSYLEMILDGERIAPEVTAVIGETRGALARTKIMTTGLLSFAREGILSTRAILLDQTIETLVVILRQILPERIRLHLALQADLLVRTDAAFLQAALLNLALNARDAMPAGGDLRIETRRASWDPTQGRLAIGQLEPGDYAEVRIADTGRGIGKELLSRLFEPWFSTKPRQRGHGLGLFMVQELVLRSQGGLVLKTAEGRGAEFRLLLPLAARPSPEIWPDLSLPERLTPHGPPRVLVVDDDLASREAVGRLLTQEGLRVEYAEQGEAALDRLRRDPDFDLVLSDLAMPGLDGLELAAALGREWPDLRVILMTDQDESALPVDVLPGALVMLHKPIAPQDWRAALKRIRP